MANTAEVVVHPSTQQAIERLLLQQPHAIIIEAPAGAGKTVIAHALAAEIVGIHLLQSIPSQVLFIGRGEDKSLKIDKVRSIEKFLERKSPASRPRVVIVEDAHTMTSDAQNALLKTFEEPPADTTIMLLTNAVSSLLTTIRSRAVVVSVHIPDPLAVQAFFEAAGHAPEAVQRAMMMSGGLPGLVHAVLEGDADSEAMLAAGHARTIVQSARFERLAQVEYLSKQKDLALLTCQMLQRMAHIRLMSDPLAPQWQRILIAAYAAEEQLQNSGQPKLVLTNLMLSF